MPISPRVVASKSGIANVRHTAVTNVPTSTIVGDLVDAETSAWSQGQVAGSIAVRPVLQRRSVYQTRRGNEDGRRDSLSFVTGGFCVTGSVAVGTPRDGQDTPGRESVNAPYLAQRADFTGNFANLAKRPIRLSRPPPSTTRPSLRVEIAPEFARLVHRRRRQQPCVTGSVTVERHRDRDSLPRRD
jgi:hypothetical protein